MKSALALKLSSIAPSKTKKETPKIVNDKHQKSAERFMALTRTIKSSQAEADLISEGEFIPAALKDVKEAELNGDCVKTVLFSASNGESVTTTFKNQYKPMNADAMEIINSVFKKSPELIDLFQVKKKATVKPAMLEKLRERLADFADMFLEIEETVTPVSNFIEKRAEMRASLTKEQAEILDTIIEQCQYKPMISCPKEG